MVIKLVIDRNYQSTELFPRCIANMLFKTRTVPTYEVSSETNLFLWLNVFRTDKITSM